MSATTAPTSTPKPPSTEPTAISTCKGSFDQRRSMPIHIRRNGGMSHWEVNAAFSSQYFSFQRFHQPMPAPELLFKAVSIADRGMTSPKRKEVAHG